MKFDLVFEGGGAKGIVFVGACEEFFNRGHSFGRLLGTSAGAITATLLAAGYQPQEMRDALTEQKEGVSVFSTFMGTPEAFTDAEVEASATLRLLNGINFDFLGDRFESIVDLLFVKAIAANETSRHVVALIERGGWFGADAFIVWLSQKLDSGHNLQGPRRFSRLTLSEYFDATKVELSLVASDTTDGRLLVLNHHTAPDCPVINAVRMSMSIPFVWDEVIWDSTWGKYRENDIQGHAIVDGGMLSNFPIELFISDEPHVVRIMGPKQDIPILGMLIDESLPVEQTAGHFVHVDINISELNAVQRLKRLVDTATTAHDKMVIDEHANLVVRLPAAGYGTTEFDLSDQRRAALVAAGQRAMVAYFDNLHRETERYAKNFGVPPRSAADRIASKILSLDEPTFD